MTCKGLVVQKITTTKEKQRTTYKNPKKLRPTKGSKPYITPDNKEAAG